MSEEQIDPVKPSAPRPAKEPWDVERFEQFYNQIAVQEGGWRFEKTPEKLRDAKSCYEGGRHVTLHDFAKSWFLTTQRW